MALFQLFHHVRRDCAAELGAALDGQAVDYAELHLARLDLVRKQGFERVLRHAGDHRADAVAAAHADDELIQLGIIDKVVLRLHVCNAFPLALDDCFKLIQDLLVDRHWIVLLY